MKTGPAILTNDKTGIYEKTMVTSKALTFCYTCEKYFWVLLDLGKLSKIKWSKTPSIKEPNRQ